MGGGKERERKGERGAKMNVSQCFCGLFRVVTIIEPIGKGGDL